MAQSVLDLVDVQFQDATNHTSITSTDTIGLVMPFYWGESDKMTVYNRTTFYEMFPESLPLGVTSISTPDLYSGYAQVKAAFAHGAGEVEIYRPSGGWRYQNLKISKSGVIDSDSGKLNSSTTKFDDSSAVTVALKYPGFIPQSLVYGFNYVHVGVSLTNSTEYTGGAMIKLNVYGSVYEAEYTAVSDPSGNPKTSGWYERSGAGTAASPYVYTATNDTEVASGKTYYIKNPFELTLLETFEGAADPQANIGGESIFLENVVNGSSIFLDVQVTDNVTSEDVSEQTFICRDYDESNAYTTGGTPSFTEEFKLGVDKGYTVFNDYESSICTMIINPFVAESATYSTTKFVTEYDATIKNITEYRKN